LSKSSFKNLLPESYLLWRFGGLPGVPDIDPLPVVGGFAADAVSLLDLSLLTEGLLNILTHKLNVYFRFYIQNVQ
jgi:hypothetical protein